MRANAKSIRKRIEMLETQTQIAPRYVVVIGKTEEEARAQYLLDHGDDAIHEDDAVWVVQVVEPKSGQSDMVA
jgi:hypothetical protein